MISLRFVLLGLTCFVAHFLFGNFDAFSQDVSVSSVVANESASDIETPDISEKDGTVEPEVLASIQKTWQRELRVVARGELVFARMACGLNAEATDALWKALQPRLESMNDLILDESGDIGIVDIVLEEVNVLGVDIRLDKPAQENELGHDEARQLEIELDQVQLDEFVEQTAAVAYSGDGIALKANPYARLRREFREALKPLASSEQLKNYDRECAVRDEFRRDATINAIMENLQKTLQLEPKQEQEIKLAFASSKNDLEDLSATPFLHDANAIPEVEDKDIKALLTVRQRVKWNSLTVYNYPIQMPYFDSETEEDE